MEMAVEQAHQQDNNLKVLIPKYFMMLQLLLRSKDV